MIRFARIVPCVLLSLLALAARGEAQTPGASDTSRFYVEFDTGASLGHKASGFYGGEAGYRIAGPLAVFAEFGHIPTVGTDALDAKAKKIADAVGATSDAKYGVTYYDFGIRYTPDVMLGTVHPYLAVGFGAANVNAQTTFFVSGAAVPPESLGISIGSDLDGSETKGLVTFGGGVTYLFGKRYFIDGSFRYGYIMAKSAIENDSSINTVRASIGVGVTF